MSSYEEDEKMEPESDTEFQFDAYGIKYRRLKEFEAYEEEPKSWQDVWVRVQAHLRRICVNTPGAIADGLTTVRSVLRGVAGISKGTAQIPTAIATRIRRGHSIVDAVEDQRQQRLIDSRAELKEHKQPTIASDKLKDKLEELRRMGYFADLIEQDDGSFLIVLKQPD